MHKENLFKKVLIFITITITLGCSIIDINKPFPMSIATYTTSPTDIIKTNTITILTKTKTIVYAPPTTNTLTPIEAGKRLIPCEENDICIVEKGKEDIPLNLKKFNIRASHWVVPGFSWSPDGERIVFSGMDEKAINIYGENWSCDDLFIFNISTKTVTKVYYDLSSCDFCPSWSPNGEWITFHSGGGLKKIHPDGTNLQSYGDAKCALGIEWTPDSKQIAWIDGTERTCQPGLMIGISDVKSFVSTIAYEANEIKILQGWIAWSPDGKSIATMLIDGTILLLEDRCWNKDEGCNERDIYELEEFPIHWMHTFYPQWAGENST